MNQFFTELEPITDLVELQITLKSKGGVMSVIILPKASVNDPAVGQIKPLQLSGSATELDEQFISAIKQPLQITAGIVSNIADFEASNQKASQQTAAAKAASDEEKRKKEQAQREYTKQTDIAEQAVKDKEYPKALAALAIALEVTDKKEFIQKRIKEVEGLSGKGSLFGAAVEEEVSAEPVTEVDTTEAEEPAADDKPEEEVSDDLEEEE